MAGDVERNDDATADAGEDARTADPSVLRSGDDPAQPESMASVAAIASSRCASRFIMVMDSNPLMEKSPSLGIVMRLSDG